MKRMMDAIIRASLFSILFAPYGIATDGSEAIVQTSVEINAAPPVVMNAIRKYRVAGRNL